MFDPLKLGKVNQGSENEVYQKWGADVTNRQKVVTDIPVKCNKELPGQN